MDKRGIHWQEIATALMVIAVILVVIFVFNSESRAEFKKLVGIREAVTGYKLPELGLLTPSEAANAERTPEGRKALCQAEFDAAKKTYDSGDYKSASEKYKKFLDDTLVKLGSDCPSGLSDSAKQGLEEARFRDAASLTNTNDRIAAYNKFIADSLGGNFLKDVYFALGDAYKKAGDYAKAETSYKDAERAGSNPVSVKEALDKLSILKSKGADVSKFDEFSKARALAMGYFDKKDYLSASREMRRAEGLFVPEFLNKNEIEQFRFEQIKAHANAGFEDFEHAVEIYYKLKSEKPDTAFLEEVKRYISSNYKRVIFSQGQSVKLGDHTSVSLYSKDTEISGQTINNGANADNSDAAIVCVLYDDKFVKDSCIIVGPTGNYEKIPNYPLVEVRLTVNPATKALIVDLKLLGFDGLENKVSLVEGDNIISPNWLINAEGQVDRNNRKEIFSNAGIFVQYDGNELFLSLKDKLISVCGPAVDIYAIPWDHDSGVPGPVVCPGLPSLTIKDAGHRAEGRTDYADVNFVYTP